ncbi:MAG: restriction endonuclease [Nostoc sp.]|uniref:restriction endonuclease n=2 Tax=Nostoc TaxID=1177 RepID=UPI001D5CDFE9|nr:restriction endonuclease [Nostoc sp. JL34]MBN3884669.1 restriction endonuclease [Nostoc sp. JL34]
MEVLTLSSLKTAARDFCVALSTTPILNLYGVTDGKAVGTYVELTFNQYLSTKYEYTLGSAALGIDFPGLEVDLKVTSIRQPQSSCPFRNASQKVYGLGYHLLILVYEKIDEHSSRTANLKFQNVVFVSRERTGDYQTTYGLREILRRNGNKEDVIAFLEERNFPLDEIGREILAERILQQPPEIGYLTISNALQWRLQYSRIIQVATTMTTVGVENLLLG